MGSYSFHLFETIYFVIEIENPQIQKYARALKTQKTHKAQALDRTPM